MRIRYLASFDRSFDNLSPKKQSETEKAIAEFLGFWKTRKRPSKGIGIKKLRKDFWEIRVGKKIRIILELKDDLITFVLAGNHDDIKKYLNRL